jgi:hypothetical protein
VAGDEANFCPSPALKEHYDRLWNILELFERIAVAKARIPRWQLFKIADYSPDLIEL